MTNLKNSSKIKRANRVKDDFAETAKTMINESGHESVSVRKVAERAGYSMGSIYNHFKNIDELLWRTRELMIIDVADFMSINNQEVKDVAGIKKLFESLMDYFITNPNVYRFFYFHQLSKEEKSNSDFWEDPKIKTQFSRTFASLINSGQYTMEEIAIISKSIMYCVYGMLTLYLSGNDALTSEEIHYELHSIIELVTSRKSKIGVDL